MIPTGRQIREGRRLLNLQAWQVARAAGLSTAMVFLAEISDDKPTVAPAHADAIQGALEAAGVEFIPENGGGAGVRLRKVEP